MTSWLPDLNYLRHVAAHHYWLFNRKLQHTLGAGLFPALDRLQAE